MLLEHSKCGPIGLAVLKRYVNYNNIETLCSSCSGYMAPEYAMRGHYSIKSDVFSFGILVLVIISGRKNTILNKQGDTVGDLVRDVSENIHFKQHFLSALNIRK